MASTWDQYFPVWFWHPVLAPVESLSLCYPSAVSLRKIRKVFKILCDRKYDILMVAADAGRSFGDLTTEYLGRLHKEHGTMIAVCTKHYGEMTASAYSSHKDRIPYNYTLCMFGLLNIHLLVVK